MRGRGQRKIFGEMLGVAEALHDQMAENGMNILAELHVMDINPDDVLRRRPQTPPGETAQAQRIAADSVGGLDGADHILRVATSRNRDNEVAGNTDVLD